MSYDNELCEYFTDRGVTWTRLDLASSHAAERAWRAVYGEAFVGEPRLRHGFKAEHAYREVACDHFLIVPFTSKVDGLPVHVPTRVLKGAYECRGPLVPLGQFHTLEFFISPLDFCWTMVHTHEDHGYGGPYFVRQAWVR